MSKRTQLLGRLKHVYSHNTKLVLDVSNDDIGLIIEALENRKNLIDKWEKRLAMLDKEYLINLRDKKTIKEKKFNKHMKLISRINELEMCIKDLKSKDE